MKYFQLLVWGNKFTELQPEAVLKFEPYPEERQGEVGLKIMEKSDMLAGALEPMMWDI